MSCLLIQLSFAPNHLLKDDYVKWAMSDFIRQEAKKTRITLILSSIKHVESRNNYTIAGASGEYGAYQFTSRTWTYYSKKFFGYVLDITQSENQDKVAGAKINHLVNQNYSNEQIASIWNCGSKNWKGKIGTNSKGVKYNVPKHVHKFMKIYNSLQNGTT